MRRVLATEVHRWLISDCNGVNSGVLAFVPANDLSMNLSGEKKKSPAVTIIWCLALGSLMIRRLAGATIALRVCNEKKQCRKDRDCVEDEHGGRSCRLKDQAAGYRPQAHAQIGPDVERVGGSSQLVFRHSANRLGLNGAISGTLPDPHGDAGNRDSRK